MTRAESIMEKIAGPDYPGSRAYDTLSNVSSGGLYGFMHNRALQGRTNTGKGLITKEEIEVSKAIGKEDNGKTYPISRMLTNPAYAGAAGAASSVASSAIVSKLLKQRIPAGQVVGSAAASAAAGIGGALLGRWSHARALKGRAEVGRQGWGSREQATISKLKDKK